MARARLVLNRKLLMDDGAILQTRIWEVPSPVRGSTHTLKYSLYYGKDGVRLVCYDNEAGKGDHRHYLGREMAYRFTTVRQLREDFLRDVRRLRLGADTAE